MTHRNVRRAGPIGYSLSVEQDERRRLVACQLVHRALARWLVRAPAHEPGAVSKPPAGEMVVLHLDYQPGREWLPLGRALCAPPAWTTGRLTSEAGLPDQLFDFLGQRFLVLVPDARPEADVVQQTLVVVKSEEQRADQLTPGGVAKSADHAVDGAKLLHFHHPAPLARAIRFVELLGDDAVETGADTVEPALDDGEPRRGGR